MSTVLFNHLDFDKLEARNMSLQKLAVAPTSPVVGQIYFDTALGKAGTWSGTAWDYSGSGGVQSIAVTAPIGSTGGANPTLSIDAATGVSAGSLSANDFTKLANASASNTPATLVSRDSSGNFAAGIVTANLTGTASNASNLGNQLPGFYLDRANAMGTQSSSTISDFDTQVRSNQLDQLAAPTGNVSLGSNRITQLLAPLNATDAANKGYVDQVIENGSNKGDARSASTSNINLASPGATIGGVAMAATDLVLLVGQTAGPENGLYVFNGAASPLSRATNADTSAEIRPGMSVFIAEGTHAAKRYELTTPLPITIGATALTFVQTGANTAYVGGNGIDLTGNTFDVVGGTGISVGTDVAINTAVVVRKMSQPIGNGSLNPITVTHGYNNISAYVVVTRIADGVDGVPGITKTANTVILTFAVVPTANQYQVGIQG